MVSQGSRAKLELEVRKISLFQTVSKMILRRALDSSHFGPPHSVCHGLMTLNVCWACRGALGSQDTLEIEVRKISLFQTVSRMIL